MHKTKPIMKIDLGKLIFWAIVITMLLIVLFGCNSVKKVLKDENKMREVWEKGVLKDWCKNDSVVKFLPGRIDSIPYPVPITKKELDTTVLKAAIKRAIDSSDNECLTGMELSYKAGYNDAIEKISKEKFAEKKPDTLQTTKYDTDKEKLLEKNNSELKGKLLEKEKALDQSKAETIDARKDRNKWRLRFFVLLSVFGVWLLRKPILKLIKPL